MSSGGRRKKLESISLPPSNGLVKKSCNVLCTTWRRLGWRYTQYFKKITPLLFAL